MPNLSLTIPTAKNGFYSGFSRAVSVTAKCLVGALILWAVFFPDYAGALLQNTNEFILSRFAGWYILLIASFIIICSVLAIWPSAGKLKLGAEDDKPEFSYFSWFSMMFGAGIGVGMLTWAIAEPIYHLTNNPEVIKGMATSGGEDNIRNAYKWSFLHWGVAAWSCYALVGMAMAYFSYRHKLPLTVRSTMVPLFGDRLSGKFGTAFDVVAVVATLLGASQALGYGIEQFVSGLYRIGLGEWLLNEEGTASSSAIVLGVVVILSLTIASALSGVGKGIKWLSNINMVLSVFLLSFFLMFGASWFGLQSLALGLFDYVVQFPTMLFQVWSPDGTKVGDKLSSWQSSWTVFYFAWCVAFAPFVGMFLARISKGRTVREFVLGAMLMPSLMSFVWFTWAGGTAIDLELSGVANGVIKAAPDGDKIYAMIELIISPVFAWLMAILIVVLVMTFLVTTADSAVLVINTISAGGKADHRDNKHIVVWGLVLGLMVGVLLLVGGLKAIKTAMVIAALPFSAIMFLMGVALLKSIFQSSREREVRQLPR
ncbi:MAG: BCCT family transporter [Gammaproteobacteria bacterium]